MVLKFFTIIAIFGAILFSASWMSLYLDDKEKHKPRKAKK